MVVFWSIIFNNSCCGFLWCYLESIVSEPDLELVQILLRIENGYGVFYVSGGDGYVVCI